MIETTITLPAGSRGNALRKAIRSEFVSDCECFPSDDLEVVDRAIRDLNAKRDLLEQIEFEDPGEDKSLTVRVDLLTAMLASAMDSTSDRVAESVGAYRDKDKLPDVARATDLIEQMQWLCDTWRAAVDVPRGAPTV